MKSPKVCLLVIPIMGACAWYELFSFYTTDHDLIWWSLVSLGKLVLTYCQSCSRINVTLHQIAYQCGEPNIYIFPYRCRVIPDGMPTRTIGKPKAAAYCEGNQSACVVGPKMPIIWHQAEGNNIEVEGYDLHGLPKNPGYNEKCGFSPGVCSFTTMSSVTNGV